MGQIPPSHQHQHSNKTNKPCRAGCSPFKKTIKRNDSPDGQLALHMSKKATPTMSMASARTSWRSVINETVLGHTVLTAYREGRDRAERKCPSQMTLGKNQTQRKLLLLNAFLIPSWYPISKSLYKELRNSTDPHCHLVQTRLHKFISLHCIQTLQTR